MKTIFKKPVDFDRSWYLIDAEGQTLGRLATKVAYLLRGKNKAYFTPHQECGDFVVVINADKITVSGNKLDNKKYYRHSGYMGGLKESTLREVFVKKPADPLERAIRGMLPHNRLGRKIFKNAKVYAGSNHPHSAQQPVTLEL